jgi:23S rRNA pseudouridine2604 synthase
MPDSIRFAKRVAECFSCSRREAEQYIEGGWVTLDGQVVEEPGARVLMQQQIQLLPGATLEEVTPVTVLLHKPAGLEAGAALQLITPATRIATGSREDNDIRFLKRHLNDLALTQSLETSAAGLLVMTQDWRVTRKLVDDAARIEHEYIVEVSGELAPDGLTLLAHGLTFNGKPLPPIKVSWQNETRLRFALKSPPRGLISHMCEKVGLQVVSMKRIRIGRVSMAALPTGQWRYLSQHEQF